MSKTTVLERHTHPKFSRLQIHLRSDSRFFQAVTFHDGKTKQKSLKVAALTTALRLAEEWYRGLLKAEEAERRQHPLDALSANPLMADVFRSRQPELTAKDALTPAQKWSAIKEFWGPLAVKEITPRTFKEFVRWRRRTKTLSNHTLHKIR